MMKNFGQTIPAILSLFPLWLQAQSQVAHCASNKKPNILFIIADDLRPELGCYGVETAKTPHIDRLASTSTVFENAYCNIPVSGASRASLLTGMYPKFPERFTNYTSRAMVDAPSAKPLPQVFKENGYHTVSNGKVFHHIDDHASSWSEPPFRTHPNGYDKYHSEYNCWEMWLNPESGKHINPKTLRGPFCESANVPDSAYDDGKLALKSIADLKRLKSMNKPFFLAVGFWKPHLPLNAPQKYWNLYHRDDIPLPTNRFRPKNLPDEVQNSGEIYAYTCVKEANDTEYLRQLRHGYYACVSYVDAQIGLILNMLKELRLDKNTIVLILGDHGWNLGEHNFIGKHNLMKTSTQSPLIVYVPWFKGGKTATMTEFVDIYPTLCDLCGIVAPKNQLNGKSLLPVLRNPKAEIKSHVFVQWQGGYSIVNNRYNYAEWKKEDNSKSMMIFDHIIDPQENKNEIKNQAYKHSIKSFSKIISTQKQ